MSQWSELTPKGSPIPLGVKLGLGLGLGSYCNDLFFGAKLAIYDAIEPPNHIITSMLHLCDRHDKLFVCPEHFPSVWDVIQASKVTQSL